MFEEEPHRTDFECLTNGTGDVTTAQRALGRVSMKMIVQIVLLFASEIVRLDLEIVDTKKRSLL